MAALPHHHIRTACVCTSHHHHNHFHHQQRQGPKPSTLALVNTLRKELVQQQCCVGDAADERLHGHRQPALHTKGQPSWIFNKLQNRTEHCVHQKGVIPALFDIFNFSFYVVLFFGVCFDSRVYLMQRS
jgi:hypothetical protein